jgi:hypothetical protein
LYSDMAALLTRRVSCMQKARTGFRLSDLFTIFLSQLLPNEFSKKEIRVLKVLNVQDFK